MNIRVHLSFQICVFILFDCIPRNGIVGSYGNSVFSFWRSCILFSIVSQFSHSVVSDSLWPHGLQRARLPCPSQSPRACLNSHPSSRWCRPINSSSVVPFASCLQSFPTSVTQFFASGGQSIGASSSASALPMNIQGWFPLELTDLLAVQGTLKSLLQHHSSKASILRSAFFLLPTLTSIHDYWKNHSFD